MKRLFFRVFVVALMGVLAAVAGLAWFAHSPVGLRQSPLDFTIEPGSGMRQVARQLTDAGIDTWPGALVLLARVTRQAHEIKAGSYEVEMGVTPLALLNMLTRGDVSQAELALIEGWNFRQFRAALDRHPDLRHDSAGLSDTELLTRIGADASHPEGQFFPDTYLFSRRSSDLEVLRRAHRQQQKILQREWDKRADGLPYPTPYEALIMASIVEKETGQAADRPMVASVFINRLRSGMLLQTDPTVIYGIGPAFDGNLRKRDLQTDTPYNTYTRPGLPPTPISMPGVAALRAALNPPSTEYLYFVARGDGSSAFSRTLAEHNRAVARYIRKQPP
ncbi:MAG: endolytic transglycosylase MltG [Zoogloea sp.]|uniref:endolytic transglycosylase MltG n=1 Tax=Zoogloea sp. TaxID=49181 RepID=UPI002639244E|nr:endolytic transglycosylase MltG [Zoogloea sp.]MDD2991303.1 endolytic transglycosylase MltG [Zoogloea sp.]